MRILLSLFFMIVSCSPQPLAIQNVDIIIINSSDLKTYKYSDLSNPAMGWISKSNGELFTYKIHDSHLEVTASASFQMVYKMHLGSKERIPVLNDSQFKISLNDSVNIFRIYR